MDETTTTVRLELELAGDGDCFTGRAADDRGDEIEFDGWLGLLAVIDAVLTSSHTTVRRQG